MRFKNKRFITAAYVRRMCPTSFSWLLGLLFMLGSIPKTFAQWQTQNVFIRTGWNAIFLHVDASHETLTTLPPPESIDQIWLWKPLMSPDRFIDSPVQPVTGNDWANWDRNGAPENNTLTKLVGNAAYLVHSTGAIDIEWSIQGKPVAPSYQWTSRGVNLIGFSTPETNPPKFSAFLSPAQRLASRGEFYRYDDGSNDLTPSLFNALFGSVDVVRGQAYWIRQRDEFNRYFGPFDLVLQNQNGLHFGNSVSQQSVRIRNATNVEITVILNLLASEPSPAGQKTISGAVPLLLRGAFNTSNLTYGSETFDFTRQVTLKPKGQTGAEVEVVLGVNRTLLNGSPDDVYAGILRLTDSLGYSQVDLPVSVSPSNPAGLWVGNASVNQVRHYLKNFQKDAEGNVEQNTDGSYQVAGSKTDLGTVARPFNLRLIVQKTADSAFLMQRIYHGLDTTSKEVVATQESLLDPARLASARRISSAHLPFSEGNTGWNLNGQFAQGQSVTAQVNLAHTDYGSNPFLHGFHPDHDNLNATFENVEPRGSESYDVQRDMTLSFSAPGSDFDSLVSAGNRMHGEYSEAITFKGAGEESLQIDTAGVFILRRISSVDVLTTE